jgi:integrase
MNVPQIGKHIIRLMTSRLKLGRLTLDTTGSFPDCCCGIVTDQANVGALSSREELEKMARRRFQRGSVQLTGKRKQKWVGRWREDAITKEGQLIRINRKAVLGTKTDFPTKKLALRELELRIAPINSVNYRALRTATFAEFAEIWKNNALTQHKQSTQLAVRSQLKKWLVPYFGSCAMREIEGQTVQMFVQRCTLAPKSCHNLVLTLRMMWTSARAWRYVSHDPFEGLVLPKIARRPRFFFTLDEIQRIIAATSGPLKLFFWLAAETGMRAGELCGLRIEDLDLGRCVANVRQSVWRGNVQTPKTVSSIRQFAISPKLASHLRAYLSTWRPNKLNLVFATKNGTPWDQNLVVKRKVHPLLEALGIRRCGLHAFRHTNGSLMDRLNAPMKIRRERLGHAPGSNLTLDVYTHTVAEDDRLVADQLGEMLCPNVAKLAQEKTFAESEGVVIQ